MGGIPRSDLAAALTPTLPAGWRVIERVGEADNADATTLRLAQLTIRRTPAAPRSKSVELVFEAVLTVPGEDIEAAEDRLDDEVMAWLLTLTNVRGLTWSEFTKTKTPEGRLGYRGELTTTAVNDRKATA